MPEDEQPTSANQELTTQIVTAYVRRNQVAARDLSALISAVYEALGRLGAPPTETASERTPAVSIRRSITPNAVVCLDCGWRGQVLRRHVMTAHGLSAEQYRARWKLAADHALTAPSYSERRSTMAKQIGLGRTRLASAETTTIPETKTAAQPRPKRPGRPGTKATPT
jgi:predicted transcriptional regulator